MAIRIRKLDGFDLAGSSAALLKYPGSTFDPARGFFLQYSIAAPRDGGAGGSIWLFNTAFGEANFTSILDAQQRYGIHVDYCILNDGAGTSIPDCEFYRIGTAARVLFALRQRTDGRIDIRTYSSGGTLTLLGTTSFAFPVNQFSTLEVRVKFGTSGEWKVRADGNVVAMGTGVNFGLTFPDRHTFRFQGFGPPGLNLDNYVIWDDDSDVETWLGRCRVTTLLPIADAAPTWSRNGSGTLFGAVDDSPGADGDTTYLTPPAISLDNLFQFAKSPCYGKVLAVAVNICGRPVSGTPSVGAIVREKATTNLILPEARLLDTGNTINLQQANLAGYATYQAISAKSFETMAGWIDNQITNAFWGISSDNFTTFERVTQVYLEKLVDLTGLPFTCGGPSNYSY